MSTGFAVPTDFSNTTGGNFEPIPRDNHIGVCIGVIDLGTHQESYQGGPPKSVRKVKLQFELPGVERTDGKAAIISATYNYSMHEKATFRKTLNGWLGNDWPERFKGQSWEFLIGTPAMVNVESGPGKRDPSRTVTWIESIGKFPKGLPAPRPTRDSFWLDLSAKVLPETLSVWDATKVRDSAEYKAGGFTDNAPWPDGSNAAAGKPTSPLGGNGLANPMAGAPVKPCPPALIPVLAKYGLGWPYSIMDIPDQIDEADHALLTENGIPF